MSDVTIHHDGGETTIKDPAFIDTLCNTNQVAVDGETFEKVSQVQFDADAPERSSARCE